jgi:hypothetical protein
MHKITSYNATLDNRSKNGRYRVPLSARTSWARSLWTPPVDALTNVIPVDMEIVTLTI